MRFDVQYERKKEIIPQLFYCGRAKSEKVIYATPSGLNFFSGCPEKLAKGENVNTSIKKYLKNKKGFLFNSFFISISQQMLLLLSMVMVGLTAMEFPDVVTSPLERPQMLEPTILVAVASFSAPGMWTQS